jgi:hypothetical protein
MTTPAMTTPATTTPATTTPALLRSDFLRSPLLATARPDAFKEWHHYLVQGPDRRVLVNFSLTGESLGGRPPRLVPRVIVIAHDGRWTGAVERFDPADVDVSADLCTLRIGRSRMTVGADGLHVVVDLPQREISGELHLVPSERTPLVCVTNQPFASGRISWLFVPRLRAHGRLRVGRAEHRVDGDVAYHDHNWGHFRWGDDVGWEWGSILPSDPDDPWSVVFTRTTDRHRLRCTAQALYLWHHDELAAMFRDAAVTAHSSGLLGRGPDCTLPPPMQLVLGGAASDVPATVELGATSSAGTVTAVFSPQSHARLALPSELAPDRSVVLSEISGTARITGSVGGREIDAAGSGVVEVLRG